MIRDAVEEMSYSGRSPAATFPSDADTVRVISSERVPVEITGFPSLSVIMTAVSSPYSARMGSKMRAAGITNTVRCFGRTLPAPTDMNTVRHSVL